MRQPMADWLRSNGLLQWGLEFGLITPRRRRDGFVDLGWFQNEAQA